MRLELVSVSNSTFCAKMFTVGCMVADASRRLMVAWSKNGSPSVLGQQCGTHRQTDAQRSFPCDVRLAQLSQQECFTYEHLVQLHK